MDHARSSAELAKLVGNSSGRVLASWALGVAHALAEEWPDAVGALKNALAHAREHRAMLIIEPPILTSLAEAHLGIGDAPRAHAFAEESLAMTRARGTRTQEIEARLALARVCLRAEGVAARTFIEAALERASHLVAQTGARAFEPHVHVERARLARLIGDELGRQRALDEAHRLFTALGAPARAVQLASRDHGS